MWPSGCPQAAGKIRVPVLFFYFIGKAFSR
jgi:hypothetical protein